MLSINCVICDKSVVLELPRGEFLIDGVFHKNNAYDLDVVILEKAPERVDQVQHRSTITYFHDEIGGQNMTPYQYQQSELQLLSKYVVVDGLSSTDENGNPQVVKRWTSLQDELGYNAFCKRWKPVYKQDQVVVGECEINLVYKLNTNNQYLVPCRNLGQALSSQYVKYMRHDFISNYAKEVLLSLKLTEGESGDNTFKFYSHNNAVSIFVKDFHVEWKSLSDSVDTYELQLAKYNADKLDIENKINPFFKLRSVALDASRFLSKMNRLESSVRAIESKRATEDNFNRTLRQIAEIKTELTNLVPMVP